MKSWAPETVFVILAACFGTAFALLTPPFDAPDEMRHLGRAFLISEGRLAVPGQAAGHGSALPEALLGLHPQRYDHRCKHRMEQTRALLGASLDAAARVPAPEVTTRFPPLAYLPQALALALARPFDSSAAGLLYLGRLGNLAAWCALVWLAIRTAPRRRWALVVLALTPMATFLSGSMTADAMTTALALCFFAGVLRLALAPDSQVLSPRELAVLAAGAALLGLAKPGYWPLVGLVWLIPASRFGGGRRRVGALAAAAVVSFAPAALWAFWTSAADPVALGRSADPAAQLTGILAAPGYFTAVVIGTLAHEWIPWLAGFVGVLGKLDVALPYPIYALVPLLLVGVCLLDAADPPLLTGRRRLGLAALFVVCFVGILVLAYVGWNPVGAAIIADVHGRYFLPLAPLLLLAIPSRWPRPAALPAAVVLFCGGILAVSLWQVVRRFYLTS